ncbi:MAG: GNAT family acetyltransferase [Sphingobium sp.]
MPLSVREAAAIDEQQVVDLWEACDLTVSYNDPRADYRFALSGNASTVLVAQDDDRKIVGTVMVGHDGHRGWLYYLAADPEARGTGIGRLMVTAGENWLKQRRVRKVQLMVRPTNTAVVSFYDHLGYEDMPRVLMSKWLDKPD